MLRPFFLCGRVGEGRSESGMSRYLGYMTGDGRLRLRLLAEPDHHVPSVCLAGAAVVLRVELHSTGLKSHLEPGWGSPCHNSRLERLVYEAVNRFIRVVLKGSVFQVSEEGALVHHLP